MCENKPLGLVPFCGEALSGTSEEAQAMGDGMCFGAMRMYFHAGGNDFVLFKEWVPCSDAQQAITIIAILTAGIFNGFLKALRARIEQNLAIRGGMPPLEKSQYIPWIWGYCDLIGGVGHPVSHFSREYRQTRHSGLDCPPHPFLQTFS